MSPTTPAAASQPTDPPFVPSSVSELPSSPPSPTSSAPTSAPECAQSATAEPALLPTASPPLCAPAVVFRTSTPPLSPTAPTFHTSTPPLSPTAPAFRASSESANATSPEGAGSGIPLGQVPRPSKKANITELRATLMKLGMDARGKKETLYKRLFAAYIRQCEDQDAAAHAANAASRAAAPAASKLPKDARQPHVSYLCFDVEATCMSGKGCFDYPNEIIEFPVVLMQWVYDVETDDEGEGPAPVARHRRRVNARLEHVDTFHTYVRPTWRPQLSTFCTSLTGIQQSTVDAAPTFPEVLVMLEDWLRSWGLLEKDELQSAMWVTDGPWDLKDFVAKQLHITPTNPPRYPKYFLSPYLNIKAAVRTVLAEEWRRKQMGNPPLPRITTGRHARWQAGSVPPLTITGQLAELGVVGGFEGRQHSGIDDATNISRILRAIADRGVLIESNAMLPPASNSKRWAWMGQPGEVLWNTPPDPIGAIETDLIRLTLNDMASAEPGKTGTGPERGLRAICATT